ncbi:MAG: hypothetical protein ABIH39_02680 [Candidatus Margulisiibacteriota bacterium]
MKKIISVLLFIVCCSCILSAGLRLHTVPEKRHDRNSAAVMMNNQVLARFYGDEDGVGNTEDRARVFTARMTQLAAMGVEHDDPLFYAGIEGDRTIIKYDKHLICTIVEAETTVNQTNDVVLAQEWLKNIRGFLKVLPRDSQYVKEDVELPINGIASRFIPLIQSSDYIVAHRSLPLGTKVRIVNLENSWSLVALVAERGITSSNIIVGLAPNTAEALGIQENRLVKVRLEKGG